MMTTISLHISISFICVVIAALFILLKASNKSTWVLITCLGWLAFQTIISLSGFYLVTDTTPPRFVLVIGPPMLLIILLFATTQGRKWIDSLNIQTLVWIHALRIPVEIVLLWLAMDQLIPVLMTFEGKNFDIISGITAPFIIWMLRSKWKYSKIIFLVWNFVCLGLVLNVVIHAIFALPSPFQQLAFDQPNVGVLYFPMTWLPGFMVPAVIFGHLVGIRRCMAGKNLFSAGNN